jgi:hypothetical protein
VDLKLVSNALPFSESEASMELGGSAEDCCNSELVRQRVGKIGSLVPEAIRLGQLPQKRHGPAKTCEQILSISRLLRAADIARAPSRPCREPHPNYLS